MKALVVRLVRSIQNGRRSGKRANRKLLEERGEDIDDSFIVREANEKDIEQLARLHVETWNDTYPMVKNPPTYAIREWQWKDVFSKPERNWFVYLVERKNGDLIGFTKGIFHGDSPGELNKIYLLREYQRMGLGRRMLGIVARRFLSQRITAMYVIAEASNPSCWFYEATGGVNMRKSDGSINYGNYFWHDLEKLSASCP